VSCEGAVLVCPGVQRFGFSCSFPDSAVSAAANTEKRINFSYLFEISGVICHESQREEERLCNEPSHF
jgi:hypothetical protein